VGAWDLGKKRLENDENHDTAKAKAVAEADGMVIDVDADQDDSEGVQEGSSKRPRSGDKASTEPKRRRVEKVKLAPKAITTRQARVHFFTSFDYTHY